jgi:hypothetical protein
VGYECLNDVVKGSNGKGKMIRGWEDREMQGELERDVNAGQGGDGGSLH